MLFNSFAFGVFFVIVTIAYFVLPHRYRWFMLLAASCYFYMAFIPVYILILVLTIVVDYVAGIKIESSDGKKRKLYLVASIIANLGVLAIFKYFNFFNGSFAAMAATAGTHYPIKNLSIILPIGLSFHTFQSLSYTIEVYRERQKAERHLGLFALYVMFYPQLVAGPIERPQNVLHQLHEKHDFNYTLMVSGLRLMAWGLLKKMVVADRLSVFVDAVYNNPKAYGGFALLLATYFFAIQIYCDFSGYSDIAVGSARTMGFHLMENFRQPYLAPSIQDFWRRWHISLSTWFRDYLYIPLGGNRVPVARQCLNTMLVFVLSGLWHGANWTFVIWGALHGLYMMVAILLNAARGKTRATTPHNALQNIAGIFITFNLVCLTWIFFRAASVEKAWYITTHLFKDFKLQLSLGVGTSKEATAVAILCFIGIEIVQYFRNQGRFRVQELPAWGRWLAYYVVVMLILLFGVFQSKAQFIYFQF